MTPNENADSESGLVCGKKKATVPWGHIADHLYEYIDKRYFPSNILFKEPTKLPSVQVGEILHFWHRRQQNDPQDIFCFAQWKDNDGLLQPSHLNLDTNEELTEGAVQAKAILPECHQQASTGAVVFLTYSVCINSAAQRHPPERRLSVPKHKHHNMPKMMPMGIRKERAKTSVIIP